MQQFAVIVKPNPKDGGFIATVPGRPEVVGKGQTEEAALDDVRMVLEATAEAGDGGAANGAEAPEATPRPFDFRPDLQSVANEQGVEPADDFDALLGDFWPDDESADDFVDTLGEWRRDGMGD